MCKLTGSTFRFDYESKFLSFAELILILVPVERIELSQER
jgi:hypothetical protein